MRLDLPSYPGRGILCGTSRDGVPFVAYFLTARSPSSRNRLLVCENERVMTTVADPRLVIDPSLLIYTAMQRSGGALIAANGDHSDRIAAGLARGLSHERSLERSCYEPDSPHYTPRISAVAVGEGYSLSMLRRRGGACERDAFHYAWDTTHLIHTYEGDGEVLPSFIGDPRPVACDIPLESLPRWVWRSLDERHRVSVAVWALDGPPRIAIINRHQGGREEWTALH